MRRIVLVCGLLASGFAYSADWVYVTKSKDGEKYYVDYDYYKYDKKSNNSELWYKVEGINNGNSYTERKVLTKYSCNSKLYKDLSIATYFPSGMVKDTYSSNYYSEYRTVFPDTVGEELYKVACDTPEKGLDFKNLNIEMYDDYQDYIRAKYAYTRQKMPDNHDYNPAKNIKIENYANYGDYIKDVNKELNRIRLENIEKNYK
ncbi:hypothetical protein NCY62_13735 [Acinetobacter pittii]|uniref:surface-adhesin E family protein n=1 Tax=Acinetobacter pittii TaxID=48296 RepID=UPI00202DC399|nr:surface-adhesin E family protein [Acinetobacter pittii]MCM1964198.1 hypothetical protein [Acinetobacter pittii]MCM1980590.1 hypothetical protein [Acinetobacter pittii]